MVQKGHPGGPGAEAETLRAVLLAALSRADAGEWEAAHALVQSLPSEDAAWIHAHLHRVEGDDVNARYWYGRARREAPDMPLDEERRTIRAALERQ